MKGNILVLNNKNEDGKVDKSNSLLTPYVLLIVVSPTCYADLYNLSIYSLNK